MLIAIDNSAISDALASGGSSAQSRDCIENFLLSHHAGKHVVLVEPEQASALDAKDLAPRAKGALRQITGRWSEIRTLPGRVRWYMNVGLGPAFDGRTVNQEGKTVIQAALHDFHDLDRASQSVLLGENLTDAALYVTMGKAFVAQRGLRDVQIAFDERGGGGTTTAPAFERLVSDGKIVLVIADSDKRHPRAQIGGTAAKVQPIQGKAFQHVHVLPVRSAENLISSAVYQEAFAKEKSKQPALALLMQAEAIPSAIAWRDHAELKQGIKLFQVRAMAPGSPEAAFWSSAAADLRRDQCQQVRQAPCSKAEECRCYVTDALGKDALKLVVAWMKPGDARRNASLLGLATGTPTGDLCEKLLAWGIALVPRPA